MEVRERNDVAQALNVEALKKLIFPGVFEASVSDDATPTHHRHVQDG
jgi:hypothetical protein